MLRVPCFAIACTSLTTLAQPPAPTPSSPTPPASTSPTSPTSLLSFTASGFLIDSSHPWRHDDQRTVNINLAITIDPSLGEATIALSNPARPDAPPGVFHWRRGRIFESNEAGDDLPATPAYDIPAEAFAVIHPALLDTALRERPELTLPLANDDRAVTISGVLWRLHTAPDLRTLTRPVHDERRGTQTETVELTPNHTIIRHNARIIADLTFTPTTPPTSNSIPRPADSARDPDIILTPADITFTDKGGGLYACDLARLKSRVFIVEFADALLMHEGAFSSRNVETIAAAAESHFNKPIRWFTFSHIHPQYVSGARALAARGTTLITPAASIPVIEQVLAAPFDLRPDQWSAAHANSNSSTNAQSQPPTQPKIQSLTTRWTHADDASEVIVLNNQASTHTDDYTLVYLPRTKTLLSGDLIFYQPGKPAGSRATAVANFMTTNGITPSRFIATWPLSWPGAQSEGAWADLFPAPTP